MNGLVSNQAVSERPMFLTDGGLETTLLFHEGWDLPEFAAFPLLVSSSGRATLRQYYQKYLDIAEQFGTGFVLETPTWRASRRWGEKLGYTNQELDDINQSSVALMRELAAGCSERLRNLLVISGQIGPQDDGYQPEQKLTASEAEAYHSQQLASFAAAEVDQVDAITLTYVDEAIGIARAASRHDLPVILSFTVETNGDLPDGTPLGHAIQKVDAATHNIPAHYMINCAHPDHFSSAIASNEGWLGRIGGVRANASRMSHEELDNAETLDEGNPDEFGRLHRQVLQQLPNLWVVGGCCGTDHRHVAEVAKTLC